MQLAGAVGGEHDHGRHGCRDGAELGDGHLPGREHLEQEGLELVVGAVDLVDEQHGGGVAQGPQHRAGEQEALVEQALLDLARRRARRPRPASSARRCRIWRGKSQS